MRVFVTGGGSGDSSPIMWFAHSSALGIAFALAGRAGVAIP